MAGFQEMYFNYIEEIEPYLNMREYHLVLRQGSGGRAIHNTYINVVTGGGILVFLPWIYLLFSAVIRAHNIPHKYPQIIDGVDIHNYAQAVEIGLLGAYASITFINCEFHDFYYWHMTMAGIIANIGLGKLKREELGEEEFGNEPIASPTYS